MSRINKISIIPFFVLFLCSCNGQSNCYEDCQKKFGEIIKLSSSEPTRQSALDSAMELANECMQCDSMKKAIVEIKIRLFATMKKYHEGIEFIDSLKESDFIFGYRQKFWIQSLKATEYESEKDTVNRDLIYKEMVNDMEQYIKERNINDTEFKDIYTMLFAVKEKYLDANQINEEIEELKNKYPDKQSFLDFLKKEQP